MQLKIAQDSDQRSWDHYVLNHPCGIPYQLWAWKTAVEKSYGFKGKYLMGLKGNKIVGVLPSIYLKPPIMPGRLVSLPYCDAGGPLTDNSSVDKFLLEQLYVNAAICSKKVPEVRAVAEMAQLPKELTVNHKKVRMLLDLPNSSEALLASFKAKVRSQVKKPIKDGLTIQIGCVNLLDEFYKIFCTNMRDLGSPVHTKKWFKTILQEYKNRSQVFVVRMPDNTPAATGIILCHTNTISVPWASSLRQYNRWNPNMLLYWGFLKFASDNGYRTFDFGRSTPDQGTYRFKKQWGARPEFLHWIDFNPFQPDRNPVLDEPEHTIQEKYDLRNFAESIIQLMPMGLFKQLGYMTRKYISL